MLSGPLSCRREDLEEERRYAGYGVEGQEEEEEEEEEDLDLNAVTLPELRRRNWGTPDSSLSLPPARQSPSSTRTMSTTTSSSSGSSTGEVAGEHTPAQPRFHKESQQQLNSARSSVLQWAFNLVSPRAAPPTVVPASVALTNTPTTAHAFLSGSSPSALRELSSANSPPAARATTMALSNAPFSSQSGSPSSPVEPSASLGPSRKSRGGSMDSNPMSQGSSLPAVKKVEDEDSEVERLHVVQRPPEDEGRAVEDTASRQRAREGQTSVQKVEGSVSPAVASLVEHLARQPGAGRASKTNQTSPSAGSHHPPKEDSARFGAPTTSPSRATGNRRTSMARRSFSHRPSSPVLRSQRHDHFRDVSEFDPLSIAIPQDWMMGFDSPKSQQESTQHNAVTALGGSAEGKKQLETPRQRTGSTLLQQSLLDTLENEYASPGSTIKYTVREYEQLQGEMAKRIRETEELSAQLERLRSELERKSEDEKKTRLALEEYKTTVTSMMETSTRENERHAMQIKLAMEDRDRARDQVEMVERSFIDLRNRYDELANEFAKDVEQRTSTIEQLKRDVVIAEQRYNILLAHAEEKMASANAEITKVRSENEKEITALKAKLSRTQLQVRSLDWTVAAKTKENAELVSICDTLMAKMEGQT